MTSEEKTQIKKEKRRYELIDSIRGLTLISMMAYHGIWDLVYLFGLKWNWYLGEGAYLWQQSICWTFIFLSGFCWSFGKRPFKRGVTVFLGGMLISLVTGLFMPENRVLIGILTFLGTAMLVMIPLDKLLCKIPKLFGMIISFLLFLLTRNVNNGFLGFENFNFCRLPAALYRGTFSAFFGFPGAAFFSTDYFSLFPWLFLFICGYFFFSVAKRHKLLERYCTFGIKPLVIIGKYSLPVYILHQPLLYLVMSAVKYFK